MSLDDRDWYRDALRERDGLKPKWQLWKSKGSPTVEERDNPYYVKPPRPWHPVLLVMVFVAICVFTLALLKLLLPK